MCNCKMLIYHLLNSAMITCMDEGIGDITDALKENGLWDNTIIIFTSGNLFI